MKKSICHQFSVFLNPLKNSNLILCITNFATANLGSCQYIHTHIGYFWPVPMLLTKCHHSSQYIQFGSHWQLCECIKHYTKVVKKSCTSIDPLWKTEVVDETTQTNLQTQPFLVQMSTGGQLKLEKCCFKFLFSDESWGL